MPQIIFTKKANQDIQRCINFLAKVDASKIQDMLQTILRQISILEKNPLFGPLIEHTNMRKLVIAYGKHGYIALYAYDEVKQMIIIQTLRHMRELGYL